MFSFFKRKPVLSDEDVTFQRETYKWLLKYFGGKDFYTHTQLVLPTDAFFPSHIASPDEAVTTTFLQVRQHAGMGVWPCALVPQEADDDTMLALACSFNRRPILPMALTVVMRQSLHFFQSGTGQSPCTHGSNLCP